MLPKPTANNFTCPLQADFTRVANLSGDLAKAMRLLRRRLVNCSTCSIGAEECPTLKEFNAKAQSAIEAVYQEWNTTAESING